MWLSHPAFLRASNWSGLPVLQSVDRSSHSTWALAIGQADTVRMATPDMAATDRTPVSLVGRAAHCNFAVQCAQDAEVQAVDTWEEDTLEEVGDTPEEEAGDTRGGDTLEAGVGVVPWTLVLPVTAGSLDSHVLYCFIAEFRPGPLKYCGSRLSGLLSADVLCVILCVVCVIELLSDRSCPC